MIAAVLETMWGTQGKSPGWFRINPRNFTGRRLHYLTGQDTVWVTNACPEQVGHANAHGKPDPEWLANNLKRAVELGKRPEIVDRGFKRITLLLICGEVAKKTYSACGQHLSLDFEDDFSVMYIPHPAARNWTKKNLRLWRNKIARFRG